MWGISLRSRGDQSSVIKVEKSISYNNTAWDSESVDNFLEVALEWIIVLTSVELNLV